MRRLVFVIHSLAGGGAERVTLNLAEGFANLGFDVAIVLAEGGGRLAQSVDSRVRVHVAERASTRAWTQKIRRVFESERPDAAIAMMEGAGVAALLASGLGSTDASLRRVPRTFRLSPRRHRVGRSDSRGRSWSERSFTAQRAWWAFPMVP
ncbi:MAG: glycosyltransferase [Sandaracinaceae bacterium]|nr:glycosyltransferase [Sandaracinaceae bacterium]